MEQSLPAGAQSHCSKTDSGKQVSNRASGFKATQKIILVQPCTGNLIICEIILDCLKIYRELICQFNALSSKTWFPINYVHRITGKTVQGKEDPQDDSAQAIWAQQEAWASEFAAAGFLFQFCHRQSEERNEMNSHSDWHAKRPTAARNGRYHDHFLTEYLSLTGSKWQIPKSNHLYFDISISKKQHI